ncbi:phosphate transporter [Thecamonas trahens ATCC 50062]|uniref:Phosphate transporter n=1 Tax=Thecamonas trahens ATCC 50062 TaxID=461836 RepID=A0A0L0DAH7_THETB|nr:phosphate transporter [Thecamonas trahens ATCC 50062]KNC48308.1 phosphate transporter [Thecamonas trahens ATCC 50062]|eukprot:XP_013758875.1 phosphate transporter [Thecamonas trahens ATCC 50062]
MGAVAEFLGVVLMGGGVARAVKEGFVVLDLYADTPIFLSLGMFATLAAAALWLLVSTYAQLPVSTTHSVVGGLVGFALLTKGSIALKAGFFSNVALSWVLSPALGAAASFAILKIINSLIFDAGDRGATLRARRYLPPINAATAWIMALFIAYKGLPNLGYYLSSAQALGASALIAAAVWALSLIGVLPAGRGNGLGKTVSASLPITLDGSAHGAAENAFVPLLVVTALLVAFAHGSNDVSNGVGCLLVMREVAEHGRLLTAADVSPPIPSWIMVMGGLSISAGLLALGARVMATMGSRITKLTPSRGFAAQLATSTTVLLATALNMPVSSTHTMVGAVTGLALASRGSAADINYGTIKKIVVSWVITLPIGAVTTLVIFYLLKALFYTSG